MNNPYVPCPVRIDRIAIENEAKDIKTFTLVFDRKEDEAAFSYLPGQFAQLSLPGKGESPIGIASSPTEKGILLFSVKRVGTVTGALHDSEPGDRMGVRGPLGKPFPWERLEGKDVVIV
ncbi:MAG: FAD-binding oxidoreductase, partial [Planctomycetes bacterium]|nr:FAD-binding oxidoreductase [Planctomycetota bacterium]